MKKIGLCTLGLSLMMSTGLRAQEIYVRAVEVEGLKRVEQDTVLSYINVPTGQTVSQEKLDDSLKQLYNTGLFTDIVFDVKNNGLLTIRVIENPIVNQRYFDGNDKVSDEMLEKEVALNSGSIYDQAKVQEDVQRILQVYKRTGRYATSVVPKIIKRDQNRVDLIYEINEGPLANITKINFVGNKHYSDDDLANAIMSKESRWYRIFSSSETYDADKSNYDKELLRRFYLKRGYADFQVTSAIAELSPDKTSFVLNYVVDEGKRYQINDIKITSEIKDVNVDSMYQLVDVQVGDWYDDTKVDASVSAITEELANWLVELSEDAQGITQELDVNGCAEFYGLSDGLYLLVQSERMEGFYPFPPLLITLPLDTERNIQIYPTVAPIVAQNPATGQGAGLFAGLLCMVLSGFGLVLCWTAYKKRWI